MQQTDGAARSRGAGPTRLSPYEAWQQLEGVPTYKSYYVQDLYTLELAPWERKGGLGDYINLADQYEDDVQRPLRRIGGLLHRPGPRPRRPG